MRILNEFKTCSQKSVVRYRLIWLKANCIWKQREMTWGRGSAVCRMDWGFSSEELSINYSSLFTSGRTFPTHPYFSTHLGAGQLSLFNLLKAYSLLDKEVGYCQGISFVAGVLLLHMSEEQAFEMLKFLMYDLGFRKQYRPDMMSLQVSQSFCSKPVLKYFWVLRGCLGSPGPYEASYTVLEFWGTCIFYCQAPLCLSICRQRNLKLAEFFLSCGPVISSEILLSAVFPFFFFSSLLSLT